MFFASVRPRSVVLGLGLRFCLQRDLDSHRHVVNHREQARTAGIAAASTPARRSDDCSVNMRLLAERVSHAPQTMFGELADQIVDELGSGARARTDRGPRRRRTARARATVGSVHGDRSVQRRPARTAPWRRATTARRRPERRTNARRPARRRRRSCARRHCGRLRTSPTPWRDHSVSANSLSASSLRTSLSTSGLNGFSR